MSASRPDARDAGCCIVPSQREGLRYFSFPHRYGGSGERSEPMGALMPHAALWVVQLLPSRLHISAVPRFNAARGFVGGAATASNTSMRGLSGFNAARGCFLSPPPPLRGPPPPLAQGRLGYAPFSRRITQYQLPPPVRGKWRAQRADRGAHAARGFVGGAAELSTSFGKKESGFNAARGFVGGAAC